MCGGTGFSLEARTFLQTGGVGSLRDCHRLLPCPGMTVWSSGEGLRSKLSGVSLTFKLQSRVDQGWKCSLFRIASMAPLPSWGSLRLSLRSGETKKSLGNRLSSRKPSTLQNSLLPYQDASLAGLADGSSPPYISHTIHRRDCRCPKIQRLPLPRTAEMMVV